MTFNTFRIIFRLDVLDNSGERFWIRCERFAHSIKFIISAYFPDIGVYAILSLALGIAKSVCVSPTLWFILKSQQLDYHEIWWKFMVSR